MLFGRRRAAPAPVCTCVGLGRLPFGSCSVPSTGFPVFSFPKSAAAKYLKLGASHTRNAFLSQFWRLEGSVSCFPPGFWLLLAVLGLFVVKGYQLARMNWLRFFNTLPISYGWATLSLPVCSVLMIITVLIKLVVTVMHFRDDSFSIDMHDPDNEEEGV